MTTLQAVELGVLGPLQVRQGGALVTIPGAKPRAILTMLGLHAGSVVSADTLVELLWSEDPPRTAAKALQTHISALRRTLGDGFVMTQGTGWSVAGATSDAQRYKSAARRGRDAAAAGDTSQAVASFEEALALWRGIPELPDSRRGTSEKTRWIEGHAAVVEDRADALLATGRAAEIIGELESAVVDAPLRERRWAQLMLALYRAGRQGDALSAYQRARTVLAEELGVDPGPDLRRLEAAVIAQDSALEVPAAQSVSSVVRAVTFLLTDIEGSTAAWEADAAAMAIALARHDELVEQVVTSRGGRLIKTRGEGDATFSVFDRPSAAAAAAVEMQEAIACEPWILKDPMRIRVALHTGEAEFRDGDYFGRSVNRAARLRSLAEGGQIVCSGATAELVIDSLTDDVELVDLGTRQLKNLARPEHVFELRLLTADDRHDPATPDAPLERPGLPAVLAGPGPFVGRGSELEYLRSAWQTTLAGATNAVLIAGEPGVGKTRLAGEWSRQSYDQGAVVLYGRCDEDLGAPYQPFAEAIRALAPCLGASRLRGLRGLEALLPLVPGLVDLLPDLASPTRADPDTERYALFDAVVAILGVAAASAPVVLILDDLHWATKPTLLLLRHLLRFGDQAKVQVVATYRSTDLDRSHPLAAMLADLHRDGTAHRLNLSGLDEDEVSAYVAEAGYDDQELGRALASVTGGNPFFLIEALRHVDESGGQWDQTSLPQGVREAVSRRLSRLAPDTNKALGAAAVVGSRFALELVEQVVGADLIDAFDEAAKAGIVIEEPGGRYRFNHALVRQSLLAELPSVRRMRLHQCIATKLESQPGADDELLAELAHHYFECAWAGNAAKAVEYCRRAADQAMTRLAYEGAADLYDRAVHALEEIDEELPDRIDQAAELLIARCEALLAAGDVTSAVGAVAQLQAVTVDSERLAAWATCFDGQLAMLTHPERLDAVEAAVAAAAVKLAELDDAAGEAKAHTVRAGCLARLGRVGDCEMALDDALSAARRAGEHRRVNAVLAGAPLAALWGPNPVPRAGGRCLDVVRLLRITADSPAVEVTSTRCQAVLEAFRGREAAARRMIESARRMVTESGLRHALLEVEQFAGIVELVAGDPAAAEPCLRKAYNGFRRLGLEADVAETAALLGRTCLLLDRDAEAGELCAESERLAGDALKASIAWRALRAQLLSRAGNHVEARQAAEAAVAMAERTDGLVDHGDACVALAVVLGAAGDAAGQRTAAERAVDLYERKGAVALAEKARQMVGAAGARQPLQPEAAPVEPTNACAQAGLRLIDAVNREAWDDVHDLLAPYVSVESRRRIVGFRQRSIPSSEWPDDMRRYLDAGLVRYHASVLAVRGERLALFHLELGTTDRSAGAAQDEMLQVGVIDEMGRIAQQVKFDVEDIDAALGELDVLHERIELRFQVPMDNAASRAYDGVQASFGARDLPAMRELFADDFESDDRRRTVNAGTRRGADALVDDAQGNVALGVKEIASEVVATRGERLALRRGRYSGDGQPGSFYVDVLNVIEINSDERITALVGFEPDDLQAALAELDRRYVAGEAAAHADVWSIVTAGMAALNRRELPQTTNDWANVDHRRVALMGTDDIYAVLGAMWDSTSELNNFIAAVHRLSDLGALVTWVAYETAQDGFRAEWRLISLMTVRGGLLSRSEVFDEEDLDAAIERFDHLTRPATKLENAATHVADRFLAHFASGQWDAMADMLADGFYGDDRRAVVGSGIRPGRDQQIADLQVFAELCSAEATSTIIATRGSHLALMRLQFLAGEPGPQAFLTEMLGVVETNSDDKTVAYVVFGPDDLVAAIAELDARYLAGEAAAHARVWQAIAQVYAAINHRQIPETTADFVDVDHRRLAAIGRGDLKAYLAVAYEDLADSVIYADTVHALNDFGAVLTHVAVGTSRAGFSADWRITGVCLVEGDLTSRYEYYDESELDAALERFGELSGSVPGLENTAARVFRHVWSHYAAGDWDAVGATVADNYMGIDHRRVVSAETQRGRDVVVRDLRAAADVGFTISMVSALAIRGERLVLARVRAQGPDVETIQDDALSVVEVDMDGRIRNVDTYDLEDFDAALADLDARYIAEEAAPYANTWSVVAAAYAAIGRNEFPAMTADAVSIDHRRAASFAPGELREYVRAGFELDQRVSPYIEAVHRLSRLGAVTTLAARGESRDGFDAEWRGVVISIVAGTLISRCEFFDEDDLDTALARFDELQSECQQLGNRASRAIEQYFRRLLARDWAAFDDVLAADYHTDDRRRLVGGGILDRGAEMASVRAQVDLGVTRVIPTVVAVRGERLALAHLRYSGDSEGFETFVAEMLVVFDFNAEGRAVAAVAFDVDDIAGATAELERRYLVGEAAEHVPVWSVISTNYAALNGGQLPPTTRDWVSIDHRRGAGFGDGEMTAYIRSAKDVTPDLWTSVGAVHRLTDHGAVVTHVASGSSTEGFDAEWREIHLLMVDDDRLSRCEIFDERDLDAALARFDELRTQKRRLENTASRLMEISLADFTAGDWATGRALMAEDFISDDRRRVISTGIVVGRDSAEAALRAGSDVGFENLASAVIATRGERLMIDRLRFTGHDPRPEPFVSDMLRVVEIDEQERMSATVFFDPEDIDAAYAELDARYLASEAASHAHVWSVISGAYVSFNRGELPKDDWVMIDHRRATPFTSADQVLALRAEDVVPEWKIHVEAVHRLDDFGAVTTHTEYGTTLGGFDAEWRMILVEIVERGRLSRCELFDESDLDAALARFEELRP
ncbi:MAG TPA: BTAD domain-containing putative transcriptional regulator [Mycobacterium sp.]|nr:BTAD domain-containing putative transcriptional regulator [Mycobacterium sp.]